MQLRQHANADGEFSSDTNSAVLLRARGNKVDDSMIEDMARLVLCLLGVLVVWEPTSVKQKELRGRNLSDDSLVRIEYRPGGRRRIRKCRQMKVKRLQVVWRAALLLKAYPNERQECL